MGGACGRSKTFRTAGGKAALSLPWLFHPLATRRPCARQAGEPYSPQAAAARTTEIVEDLLHGRRLSRPPGGGCSHRCRNRSRSTWLTAEPYSPRAAAARTTEIVENLPRIGRLSRIRVWNSNSPDQNLESQRCEERVKLIEIIQFANTSRAAGRRPNPEFQTPA